MKEERAPFVCKLLPSRKISRWQTHLKLSLWLLYLCCGFVTSTSPGYYGNQRYPYTASRHGYRTNPLYGYNYGYHSQRSVNPYNRYYQSYYNHGSYHGDQSPVQRETRQQPSQQEVREPETHVRYQSSESSNRGLNENDKLGQCHHAHLV